eukprot:361570-Chlamydomonas_euryale.AAC.8
MRTRKHPHLWRAHAGRHAGPSALPPAGGATAAPRVTCAGRSSAAACQVCTHPGGLPAHMQEPGWVGGVRAWSVQNGIWQRVVSHAWTVLHECMVCCMHARSRMSAWCVACMHGVA